MTDTAPGVSVNDQFQIWSAFALQQEGGYVVDDGGPTNRGVTLADLQRWSRRATVADLQALTVPETLGIMMALYWQPLRGYALPKGVAIQVVDHGYNAGVGTSARILQALVHVAADGFVGPVTASAARMVPDQRALVPALYDAQLADYEGMRDFPKYGGGWSTRCAARRDLALAQLT